MADFHRHMVLSLLRSATGFPCSTGSEMCIGGPCHCPKRCIVKTEYDLMEFAVTDPAELAAVLQTAPKTFESYLGICLIIQHRWSSV